MYFSHLYSSLSILSIFLNVFWTFLKITKNLHFELVSHYCFLQVARKLENVSVRNAKSTCLLWFFYRIRVFVFARKLKNISFSNVILTFFLLRKIHLEIFFFFVDPICGETLGRQFLCRSSAVVLTKMTSPSHWRVFIKRVVRSYFCTRPSFRFSKKKAVRLRCR